MGDRVYPDKLPNPVAVLGWDGSDFRVILVDAQHHLQADVLSSDLPDGAATEATLADLLSTIGDPEESPEGSVMATLAEIMARLGDESSPESGSVNAQIADLVQRADPFAMWRVTRQVWDTNVAAGGGYTLQGYTAGEGVVEHICLRVVGSDTDARDSCVVITVNVTAALDIKLNEILYLNGGAVGQFADVDVIEWNDGTYTYWVHWKVHIPYTTNLRIDIRNGDTANAILTRAQVIYRYTSGL